MNYVQISETQRHGRSYGSVQVDSKTDFKTKNNTKNWKEKFPSRKMNLKNGYEVQICLACIQISFHPRGHAE